MSRFLQIKIIFVFTFTLIFKTFVFANQSHHLKIIAIVLSKTCPLPDGPDMTFDSPDSILKSINNPDCPKHGDNQLIQTAISNTSNASKKIGLEIKVKVNDQWLKEKLLRKIYNIEALNSVRILHEIKLQQAGIYQISVRIWDSKFKHILLDTRKGDERYFFIPSPQDLEVAKNQLASGVRVKGKRIITPLEFDPPDLRWESVQVLPKHALRGEKIILRLNLINTGGDVVKDVASKIQYFNLKQPMRKSVIALPRTRVMAPGEIKTFNLEYILPDDQLLGKYQIIATVDQNNEIKELNEKNNVTKSNVIKLSDIKLLLPSDKFTFDENGLFLFQWESLTFSEFKIQIGVDKKFEDTGSFFDLPQGNRWISDKELVPLAGELPGMAIGLMKSKGKNKLFWRVIGRKASGQKSFSGISRFSINPSKIDKK